MATQRKKAPAAEVEREAPQTQTVEDDPLAMGEREAITTLMGELAGNTSARVTVYRAERNKPLAYMFQCSPDAFSLDDLRDKFNGGEFRLYIARDGKVWRNLRIVVEPSVKSSPVGTPDALTDLALTMREGFAMQAEAIKAALTQRPAVETPAQGIDIAGLITAIATATRPVMPPAPPASSLGATEAVSLLMKGFDLARDLNSGNSGGDSEPSLMGLLGQLLKSPMLAAAVQAAARTTPPAAPAAPRLPQPAPTPPAAAPAPAAPQPQPTQTPMATTIPTHYLAMLVAKATAGSDPTLYADLILDSVPDATLVELLEAQPSTVDALIAMHAPIAEHREWFERMVESVRNAFYGINTGEGGDSSEGSAPTV